MCTSVKILFGRFPRQPKRSMRSQVGIGTVTCIYITVLMDIDLIRLVGCSAIAYFLFTLLKKVKCIFYTHVLAKIFGDIRNLYGYGHWAVVTGSTDGIGKGYAKELARRHMNLFLISRNAQKLEATKSEINEEFKEIEIRTLAFDFGSADLSSYEIIKKALDGLDIGVLVNNVGVSSEYPEKFLDHPDAERVHNDVVMTFIVLPQMVGKKMGAIINVSSASAFLPCPYLTVYSSTKCVYPYFVATNMSRIKRPSFFAPDANSYARAALNTVGLESETAGCLSHSIQHLIYEFVPRFVYDYFSKKILLENREKYLRKMGGAKKME